ncbi:olfactory receptor 51I2-like [Ornithorhynchus anatinus]|uniref:olfactory receptor 51I2-like n=1 Tax=Ornithorhynchus anatinus TaxID=9258 RepID=UPI000223EED4|nr:olfactory receptor 51I2-like [Ornithorhynchus anatinus]
MKTSNISLASSSTFILVGIPNLEAVRAWLSIPFCLMYLTILVGNSTILYVIQKDPVLHQPMSHFLAMLAFTELGVSLSTMPTVLGIFLAGATEIDFNACLAQMYFIHSFSIMESGVLLAMAFDRFVAIYSPLRYSLILTHRRIRATAVGLSLKSAVLMAPLAVLLKRLPFCHRENVLSHSYCLHSNLISLPCTDTTLNNIYGLFVVLSTFGLDSVLIALSYALILKTVLGIVSGDGWLKALNTCVSHMCAVLVYYVPMIGLAMMHRFGQHPSPLLQVMMANAYLFIPPVVNPIVYSLKTKEIRKGIFRNLIQKRGRP